MIIDASIMFALFMNIWRKCQQQVYGMHMKFDVEYG